jgi:heavy metal sensor kinase
VRLRVTRGLRFRLTAAYALFFTLLIGALSIIFRQYLSSSLDQQARDVLEQRFQAVKGYLRIEGGKANWYGDNEDPDEATIVANMKRVYVLTDANGTVVDGSPAYQSLGMDTPDEVRAAIKSSQQVWKERRDPNGVWYLIRGGVLLDEEKNKRYYIALGLSLDKNRELLRGFTLLSAGVIPLMILAGCVMGWVFAGKSMAPVLEVAKTAQRISGSNLSLRIRSRGAGDELDYLIDTFNEMIARLENSFGQIRQFSTDVSHELRTPMTILRGQLEVALFTAETKEQYREAIVDSLQDIERLGQIVRALLLLSQAETGQVVLQRAPLDLCELLRDITDQFQIPAEGAKVKLTCTAPQSCTVELDRVQTERMLSNLLSNAIKFTAAGGEVRTRLEATDQNAVLTIEDTGRGIPPEHLPHIFDRFYRVSGPDHAASPEKGLGLGLSFVAWIVKAHGGTVHVDSEQGKGTKFTVTLPRNTGSESSAELSEDAVMKKV